MTLKNIKNTVKHLLEYYPHLRDDDNELVLNVWLIQNPQLRYCNFMQFYRLFKIKELASFESIRRARQKLQEGFPQLRGKIYEQRHAYQEVVKEELRMPEWKQGGTP